MIRRAIASAISLGQKSDPRSGKSEDGFFDGFSLKLARKFWASAKLVRTQSWWSVPACRPPLTLAVAINRVLVPVGY